MKANEIKDGKDLMIGDLILGCIETDIVGEATYKILCKVTNINHYGDVSCEALEPFPDELDWQDGDDFSWIEPIPLTPEILEKNGFEKSNQVSDTPPFDEDEEGNKYYSLDKEFCGADGRFWGWWQKDDSLLLPANCLGWITLRYVHELQHVLRLLNIDKQIVL